MTSAFRLRSEEVVAHAPAFQPGHGATSSRLELEARCRSARGVGKVAPSSMRPTTGPIV